MAQPRFRGAPDTLQRERAAEMLNSPGITLLPETGRRLSVSPAGVIVLEGPIDADRLDLTREILELASPIVSRVAALEDARDLTDRLSQQRERLTLMVDSLPDP